MARIKDTDRNFAIIEFEKRFDREKLVSNFFACALSTDIENIEFKTHVLPFLELEGYGLSSMWLFGFGVDYYDLKKEDVNEKKLRKYGFRIEDYTDYITIVQDREEHIGRYFLCDIQRETETTRKMFEAFQFMASLFVAMNSSEGGKYPIFNFKQNKDTARASFRLPSLLSNFFSSTAKSECISKVHVKDGICTATFKPFSTSWHGEVHTHVPDDWQAAFCGAVLWHIANNAKRFQLDTDYRVLWYNKYEDIVTSFARDIASGKVKPCPQCGKPVYHLRSNTSPFCPGSKANRSHKSKSCYAQYNTAAKDMQKNGASVEDVIRAFPAIREETIRSWYPRPLTRSNSR